MLRGYFGSWGHVSVAVAVVERFKKELMYLLAAETKKVAVVERWPLGEVRRLQLMSTFMVNLNLNFNYMPCLLFAY